MIILVTGGREYSNYQLVAEVLIDVVDGHKREDVMIVQGGARGADRLARDWCIANGYHYAEVPANWKRHPITAGPLRNAAMLLLKPDVVIAFPGGTGTLDMKRRARAAGIKVVEI